MATDAQGDYFRTGILAAVLPPLALLMLSSQLLIFPNGGDWAEGLIGAELVCLGRLIFIALTRQRPTADWIEARIRAELFRREEYLLIAQAGPYLGLDGREILEEADRRIGLIFGAEEAELRGMMSSHHFLNKSFIDYQPSRSDPIDLLERINSYLYLRIGKQLLWFSNEIRDCKENEALWSSVLVLSLICAFTIAFIHLLHLSHETLPGRNEKSIDIPRIITGVLAVLLPPAATAIISVKNMYAFSGRTRIYEHQRANLARFDGEMRSLARTVESHLEPKDAKAALPSQFALERQFRLIVLLTEASLANEMERWSLVMERESIEVNA